MSGEAGPSPMLLGRCLKFMKVEKSYTSRYGALRFRVCLKPENGKIFSLISRRNRLLRAPATKNKNPSHKRRVLPFKEGSDGR